MPSEFQITNLAYGDEAGFGQWLSMHFRQHLRYNDVLSALPSPAVITTFPILSIEGGNNGVKSWLNSHEKWHELIRPFAGITGIDLSDVDFTKPEQFYAWLSLHAAEHSELDLAFGVA
jgi:hypothetical protein